LTFKLIGSLNSLRYPSAAWLGGDGYRGVDHSNRWNLVSIRRIPRGTGEAFGRLVL